MGREVTLRLFGDFAAEIDGGAPVRMRDFERRTGAELVQLLAVTDGHALHRDQVLEAIWPEAGIDRAKNAFYKAATFARRALDDEAVTVRDGMVILFADWTISVDTDIVAAADPDEPASIDAALDIWRAPLLPTVPYADWALEVQDRLRRHLIGALTVAGRWHDLFELDQTDEVAAVEVMEHAVRNGDPASALRHFQRLDEALRDELGVSAGPRALTARETAVAASASPTPASERGRPLARRSGQVVPSLHTTLLGRNRSTLELTDALDSHRLVTVAGPGGVGKTALARAVGSELASAWPDGVWWASFGSVDHIDGAARELLAAIGGQHWQEATVQESITGTLRTDTALLVIDNCEHLLPDLAQLLSAVVSDCPGIKILATSRVPLGLPGEATITLGRLDPDAATALFLAEAATHGVTVDDALPTARRIVQRLDHLPLAVRLAAARAATVGLEQLEPLLDERFRLLDGVATVDQQKTLQEAISWSVASVSEETQTVLADLAILAGGFSFDTAAAISNVDDTMTLVDHLDALVAASLVERTPSADHPRHRILESVRQHVLEHQDPSARAAATERHRQHFLAAAAEQQRRLDVDSGRAFRWFRASWPDLRRAATATIGLGRTDDLARLITSCGTYAVLTMRAEVSDWCAAGLPSTAIGDDPTSRSALATWSTLERFLGRLDHADEVLSAVADDSSATPEVFYGRSLLAHSAGDADLCIELIERALDRDPSAATEAALRLQLVLAMVGRGDDATDAIHRLSVLAAGRGQVFEALDLVGRGLGRLATDSEQARADLERAMELSDSVGLGSLSAQCRTALPWIAVFSGDTLGALRLERDAITWTSQRGVWSMTMAAMGPLALLLDTLGDTATAVTLIAARRSSGFATAFGLAAIDAVMERAIEQHADRVDGWIQAGESLDRGRAAELGVRAADAILERQDEAL